MRLRVTWIENDSYIDGGAYALVMGNGHIFAELAQKGRNENAKLRAIEIAIAYNRAVI